MASILDTYLRQGGDLVKEVVSQAQQTVLQRLTAEQAAQDAAALIAKAEAMIPGVQDAIVRYGEAVEERETSVDTLKHTILDLRHKAEVAELEKNRSALSNIQIEIIAKGRELSNVQGELHSARYSRIDSENRLEKLTKAIVQLQPLLESSGAL